MHQFIFHRSLIFKNENEYYHSCPVDNLRIINCNESPDFVVYDTHDNHTFIIV